MSYTNTTHTNNDYEDDDYYTAYLEDTPPENTYQNTYQNSYQPSPPLSLLSDDLEQIINTHKHIYSPEQLRELTELRDLKKQQEQNDWYNEQIYYRSITETDSQEVKDKMKLLLLSETNTTNRDHNVNHNQNIKRSRPADHYPSLEHATQESATSPQSSNTSSNSSNTASHDQQLDHAPTNKNNNNNNNKKRRRDV